MPTVTIDPEPIAPATVTPTGIGGGVTRDPKPISPVPGFKGIPASEQPELHKGEGWPEWAAKRGLELGLGGGGAALGAAGGAFVPGAGETGISEYAGGRAGEAAGFSLADIIEALADKWRHGSQTQITPKNLAEDYAANLGGTIVGGAVPGAAKGLASGLLGKGAVREVGEDAASQVAKEAGVETPEELGAKTGAAQSTVNDAQQQGEAKANQAIADARSKLLAPESPVVEGARQEATQSAIGRAPEATQRAVTLPPEVVSTEGGNAAVPSVGTTARRTQFYNAIYGPKNRAADALGTKFDKVFAPHMEKPVDASGIAQTAADEANYAQQNGVTYSRPVQKLLDEVKNVGSGMPVSLKELGYTPKTWGRLGPREQEQVMSMAQKLRPATDEGVTEAVAGNSGATGSNVAKWLGIRSQAGELIKSAEGPDRAALYNLRESIDDSLAETGVPGAKQLRAQYRGFKTDFGPDFFRAIGKTSEPSDAMAALFKNPQRAIQVATGADAEEKATLRDLYGDAVNRGVLTPEKEQAPALKAMGFSGPLAKPEAWIYEQKAVPKLTDLFENAPAARQKYIAAVQSAASTAREASAKEVAKEARTQAKALGPAGQRIIAAMDAARTPQDQADIATKAFIGLSPDQAVGALKGAQKDAFIKAVQNAKPNQKGFYGYMIRRAMYTSLAAPPLLMMGHPYYAELAAVTGIPVGIKEMMSAAYRYSLRSPEAATAFYNAIANPGAATSLQTIAKMGVDASVADMTAHLGKSAAGISLSKPPAPAPQRKGPGPLARAIEDKRAQTIAGARGANSPSRIDRIAELDKGVAGGDTPNVTDDLKAGRLSTGEVRKIVEGHKPSVMAMFDGLSIPDSIEAFAGATREEQEAALPALANKINQEGKGMQPAQRQDMLAQLKKAMQPDQMAG
ncbi:MAG: hypothetical protein WBQ34_10035 [Candidatus Acidiferrales bacterium]